MSRLFIKDEEEIEKEFININKSIIGIDNHYYFGDEFEYKNIIFHNKSNDELWIKIIIEKEKIDNWLKKIISITNKPLNECFKFLVANNFNVNNAILSIINKDKITINPIYSNLDYEFEYVYIFPAHFEFFEGIKELLKEEKIKTNYKIQIKPTNKMFENFDLNIYIKKKYLNEQFEKLNLNIILKEIILKNKINKNKFNFLEPAIININDTLKQKYKRKHFHHQISNINWMINLENKILNNLSTIKTFNNLELNRKPYWTNYYKYCICKIKGINEKILLDKNNNLVNPNELKPIDIKIMGGLLCDEIGLGKTFSMISLIKETGNLKKEQNSTLIFTHPRLVKQWQYEIELSCDLTVKLVGTIKQYQKIKPREYDIIIISYTLLNNNKYGSVEKYLENTLWERIILDEGHEYLNYNMLYKKKNRVINQNLKKIKSKFKWICSGTPFFDVRSLMDILKYLIKFPENYNFLYNYHIHEEILLKLGRKNTKNNIKNYLNIKEPIFEDIFLQQTEIENAIYKSELNNEIKLLQMCSHITISEENIKILKDSHLSLNEIHTKMTNFFNKKQLQLENKLKKLEKNPIDLEQTTEIKEIKEKINDYDRKCQIFNKLEKKIKDEKDCPICLDNLSNKSKSVLPCAHFFCTDCLKKIKTSCPLCRESFTKNEINTIKCNFENNINKFGTKISYLIDLLNNILKNKENRIIIFSQWDNLLKHLSKILKTFNINFVYLNGSMYVVQGRIRKFKLDNSIRIVLLSSENAASGLNLQEANHIILFDTMNKDINKTKIIEDQAIGRSVRIGQKNEVKITRLIMENTIEYDYFLKFALL